MSSPEAAEQQGRNLGSRRGARDMEKGKDMDDVGFRDGADGSAGPPSPSFILPPSHYLSIYCLSVYLGDIQSAFLLLGLVLGDRQGR